MKRLLIVGISEKIHATYRLIEEATQKKLPFIFVKWSSLAFDNERIYANNAEIDLEKINAVFFDVPSFDIKNSQNNTCLSFKLDNDLFIILKILRDKKIVATNRDFLLEYPYYNKFTQQYIFNDQRIASIETVHLTDNLFSKVFTVLKKHKLEFPLVVKKSRGGMGNSVWKIENRKALADFLKDKRNTSLIFQRYIKNRQDFRVVIVGGRSLGIMKRKAKKGQWKNNFALGGKIEKYTDKRMERFAEDICRKIGISHAGIDVFKLKNRYIVIEINSFFCFEGFEKIYPNVNVAEKIINDLLLKTTL